MKKRAAVLVIALLLLFPFCGCDVLTTDISKLISPPQMSQQQAQIYKAMKNSALIDDDIVLKYPRSGSQRSAIIVQDIDEEPTEEALVFFQNSVETAAEGMGLSVCLLDQEDDEWKAKWTLPLQGEDVEQVTFFTSKRNEKFVIVGYSVEGNAQFSYQILSYSEGELSKVYDGFYQVLDVYDLDQDGESEIITVAQAESENSKVTVDSNLPIKTVASMIQYQDGEFRRTHQTTMSDKVTQYVKITKNQNSFDQPALFLDEQVGTSTYATEILIFKNDALCNLIYPTPGLYDQTMRTQVPYCYDINQDGMIEIPNTSFMRGYSSSSENPMYVTWWYQIQDNAMKQTVPAYVNYPQGFGFILPENWVDNVSAKSVMESDEILFFVYHESVDNDQEQLLSLKIDTLANIQSNGIPEGYFKIMEIGQVVFLAHIPENSDPEYRITEQQVKDNFIDLYLLGE